MALKEKALVNEHIKSASANAKNLNDIQAESLIEGISPESRAILATAAKSGAGWFKSISAMEMVARDVIGPDLANAAADFRAKISALFEWTADAKK